MHIYLQLWGSAQSFLGLCLPPDGPSDAGGSQSLAQGLTLVPYGCGPEDFGNE